MQSEFGQGGPCGSSGEPASVDLEGRKRDHYNMMRFVFFHLRHKHVALVEINRGRKESCWMWGILPTAPWVVGGRERGSQTNQEYCLRDHPPHDLDGCNAARAFLLYEHPDVNLRGNYLEILSALLRQRKAQMSMLTVLGHADAPKLISSLQLFERATRGGFDREVNALCCALLQSVERETDPRDPLPISREVMEMRGECRGISRDRDGWEATARREDEERDGSSLQRRERGRYRDREERWGQQGRRENEEANGSRRSDRDRGREGGWEERRRREEEEADGSSRRDRDRVREGRWEERRRRPWDEEEADGSRRSDRDRDRERRWGDRPSKRNVDNLQNSFSSVQLSSTRGPSSAVRGGTCVGSPSSSSFSPSFSRAGGRDGRPPVNRF